MVRAWLEHPLTRGVDLDDPSLTALRREIVRTKPFLRRIYEEWYGLIKGALPAGPGEVLEIGSGAGFLREVVPDAIASEVFRCPGMDLVLDAQRLPVRDGSLRAIAMVDVLHHLPDCRRFFAGAARAVRPGGAIVAVEPWVSAWSRLVLGHAHHEPFRPEAAEWEFPAKGPLSGANQALPWILFERDRAAFEREFPEWRVARVRPFMPLRYIASGGVGLRSLAPSWSFRPLASLERLSTPFMRAVAMFAEIVVERTGCVRDAP
jgi:SAM-dependent methyltransferase